MLYLGWKICIPPACQEMLEEAKVILVVIMDFLIRKSLPLCFHILLPYGSIYTC